MSTFIVFFLILFILQNSNTLSTSHQPILVADFGWRVNQVNILYRLIYKISGFEVLVLLGLGGLQPGITPPPPPSLGDILPLGLSSSVFRVILTFSNQR